ncbi:hypothetical protein BN946_scf184813.g1 [Trametes cinnabarina]|uniref:Methyltransferase domain-containing protein n=1 Tax=Pycnoporus cinnabarinus TaxID=5643 RepID=A0A060SRE8_PYCCI|nr:hypothetical protein BN946_scf184813.g1 [Trametes cinnabarina]
MSNQVGNSLYAIPADTPEKERLGKQYAYKRTLFGWNSPMPPSLDVSGLTDILDVGAGTCVWTFDFANMPQVKPRPALPEKTQPKETLLVRLYACDIDTVFFPDRALLDEFGVFQQDVTKPFAPELRWKFDLVHSFTPASSPSRLRTHPGMIYTPSSDLITLGRSLTYRLPHMLRAAWLKVKESRRIPCLIGKLAADRLELALFAEFSMENFVFVFRHLAKGLLAKGKLRMPDGIVVAAEEQAESMLKEVEEGARRNGVVMLGGVFVAVKEST